jgi:hypothetical protein
MQVMSFVNAMVRPLGDEDAKAFHEIFSSGSQVLVQVGIITCIAFILLNLFQGTNQVGNQQTCGDSKSK